MLNAGFCKIKDFCLNSQQRYLKLNPIDEYFAKPPSNNDKKIHRFKAAPPQPNVLGPENIATHNHLQCLRKSLCPIPTRGRAVRLPVPPFWALHRGLSVRRQKGLRKRAQNQRNMKTTPPKKPTEDTDQ